MDRSLKNMLPHILLSIENEEFEESEILETGEGMKDSNWKASICTGEEKVLNMTWREITEVDLRMVKIHLGKKVD